MIYNHTPEYGDNFRLPRIGDTPMICECGWKGAADDTLPDIDDDGNLGCPKCESIVKIFIPIVPPGTN